MCNTVHCDEPTMTDMLVTAVFRYQSKPRKSSRKRQQQRGLISISARTLTSSVSNNLDKRKTRVPSTSNIRSLGLLDIYLDLMTSGTHSPNGFPKTTYLPYHRAIGRSPALRSLGLCSVTALFYLADLRWTFDTGFDSYSQFTYHLELMS